MEKLLSRGTRESADLPLVREPFQGDSWKPMKKGDDNCTDVLLQEDSPNRTSKSSASMLAVIDESRGSRRRRNKNKKSAPHLQPVLVREVKRQIPFVPTPREGREELIQQDIGPQKNVTILTSNKPNASPCSVLPSSEMDTVVGDGPATPLSSLSPLSIAKTGHPLEVIEDRFQRFQLRLGEFKKKNPPNKKNGSATTQPEESPTSLLGDLHLMSECEELLCTFPRKSLQAKLLKFLWLPHYTAVAMRRDRLLHCYDAEEEKQQQQQDTQNCSAPLIVTESPSYDEDAKNNQKTDTNIVEAVAQLEEAIREGMRHMQHLYERLAKFGNTNHGKELLYELRVYMGDLERYRDQCADVHLLTHHPDNSTAPVKLFRSAYLHYHGAWRLMPEHGLASNQIALISRARKDGFPTLYFFLRAMCASKVPFKGAKGNLVEFLEAYYTQTKTTQMPVKKSDTTACSIGDSSHEGGSSVFHLLVDTMCALLSLVLRADVKNNVFGAAPLLGPSNGTKAGLLIGSYFQHLPLYLVNGTEFSPSDHCCVRSTLMLLFVSLQFPTVSVLTMLLERCAISLQNLLLKQVTHEVTKKTKKDKKGPHCIEKPVNQPEQPRDGATATGNSSSANHGMSLVHNAVSQMTCCLELMLRFALHHCRRGTTTPLISSPVLDAALLTIYHSNTIEPQQEASLHNSNQLLFQPLGKSNNSEEVRMSTTITQDICDNEVMLEEDKEIVGYLPYSHPGRCGLLFTDSDDITAPLFTNSAGNTTTSQSAVFKVRVSRLKQRVEEWCGNDKIFKKSILSSCNFTVGVAPPSYGEYQQHPPTAVASFANHPEGNSSFHVASQPFSAHPPLYPSFSADETNEASNPFVMVPFHEYKSLLLAVQHTPTVPLPHARFYPPATVNNGALKPTTMVGPLRQPQMHPVVVSPPRATVPDPFCFQTNTPDVGFTSTTTLLRFNNEEEMAGDVDGVEQQQRRRELERMLSLLSDSEEEPRDDVVVYNFH